MNLTPSPYRPAFAAVAASREGVAPSTPPPVPPSARHGHDGAGPSIHRASAGPASYPAALATSRRRHAGFTLIELLLVLVILGVLAAIVVPKFSGRTEQARKTAAQTQIATFGTALDAFEVDNGYYPKGSDGLKDLIEQPRDAKGWKGPYLKTDLPVDPWGNAYVYVCPGKQNTSGYDLYSLGPDGREGGDDDIVNWSQSGGRN